MQTPSAYPGTGKGQNIAIIIVIVVVIALVAWIVIKFGDTIFGFFNDLKKGRDSVLESVGLKDSAQEQEDKAIIQKAKEEASTISSPWNPAYYKNAPAGSSLLTTATGDKIAKQIYDSVGVLTDDSDKGLAAVKQCRTKTQVSWVAERFNKLYNQDLFAFFHNHYDTEQQRANLRAAIDYVNSLPAYK